jgi:hypothetical protein
MVDSSSVVSHKSVPESCMKIDENLIDAET